MTPADPGLWLLRGGIGLSVASVLHLVLGPLLAILAAAAYQRRIALCTCVVLGTAFWTFGWYNFWNGIARISYWPRYTPGQGFMKQYMWPELEWLALAFAVAWGVGLVGYGRVVVGLRYGSISRHKDRVANAMYAPAPFQLSLRQLFIAVAVAAAWMAMALAGRTLSELDWPVGAIIPPLLYVGAVILTGLSVPWAMLQRGACMPRAAVGICVAGLGAAMFGYSLRVAPEEFVLMALVCVVATSAILASLLILRALGYRMAGNPGIS